MKFFPRFFPRSQEKQFVFSEKGYCVLCECEVVFSSKFDWFRDHLLCSQCGSIPRERALFAVLEQHYPNWRGLTVHESSPGQRGASTKLRQGAASYVDTQFFPGKPLGQIWEGVRCENLESMTFPDESFDLHVTQDVLEHIFDPFAAFAEIARTLKKGGAHIFTVPLVAGKGPSRCAASLNDAGELLLHEPAVYHGNPISSEGSLVTYNWGYDLAHHIYRSSGLVTQWVTIEDLGRGIGGSYIDVGVSIKV